MKIELYNAIFLCEMKGRFLCKIIINGNIELAHVPNSAKLSKYIDMNDRPVLVTSTKSEKAKTKYRLVAVRNDENWIFLNLNLLNSLVAEYFAEQEKEIEHEKMIYDSYRTDLIIRSETTDICEVKGVLSESENAIFPKYAGVRAYNQMLNIKKVLREGVYNNVYYGLVIMNPDTQIIAVNKEEKQYHRLFKQCVKWGMVIMLFDIVFDNDELRIVKSSKTLKI